MFEATPHQASTPETAAQIICSLSDPPIAVRESLKFMFVSAARRFFGKQQAETEAVCDHYEALDAMLEKIEAWQDNA